MCDIRRKELVNCSWCSTVKRRDTNEPIPEPLQTQLKKEIDTHGMCGTCATDVRNSSYKPNEPLAETVMVAKAS